MENSIVGVRTIERTEFTFENSTVVELSGEIEGKNLL
jgi:hypothetical protein